MSEQLKPCPFCGEDAKVYGDRGVGFFVGCLGQANPGNKCFAAIGENYDRDSWPEHLYQTEAEAVSAWNRRTEPTPESQGGWPEKMTEREFVDEIIRRCDDNNEEADHG